MRFLLGNILAAVWYFDYVCDSPHPSMSGVALGTLYSYRGQFRSGTLLTLEKAGIGIFAPNNQMWPVNVDVSVCGESCGRLI